MSLPEPGALAIETSAKLRHKIGESVKRHGGMLGFDDYMRMALYDPDFGYYNGGASKFGADGDFITAPLVSPVFSRCLARQCGQILEMLGGGCILELGAGDGAMARDVLLELRRLGVLPEAYHILEPSGSLRTRQRQTIQQIPPRLSELVAWLDCLPETPMRGVILANEVLDAMPVKRILVEEGGIREYAVACASETFNWQTRKMDEALAEAVRARLPEKELPPPYITEINPVVEPWIGALSDALDEGVILLSDYGYARREYYHPQRSNGTLVCYYRHRSHQDPFFYPGLQDISVAVDFSAVFDAAEMFGLGLAGFTTQAHFLLACGLTEYAGEYMSDQQALQALKKLSLPGEMGEIFKFIGLSNLPNISLMGFNGINFDARL